MAMRKAIRVENGKYVGGTAGTTKASQVYLSDGVTSVEAAMPRTYSKTITNQAVSTAWGSGYSSAVIDVDLTEDARNKNVTVSFVPSGASVALIFISDITSNKVSVQLVRFTSGTVSGTINVLVK